MEKMIDEITKLKLRYRSAKSEKEKDSIFNQISELASKDVDSFSEAVIESIRTTNRETKELIVKTQLKDILGIVSVSYIAKTYFKRTAAWFYQRLNNNIVNGKKATFTSDEIEILKFALTDISHKISTSASKLG